MEKKNSVESITGKESVEDLIAMVDRQDNPSGVIAMISLTTQMTNPATYNQFASKLKKERPEIYNKYKKIFNPSDSNDKSSCFIATATMKDYNHPIVIDLRNFRDMFLLKNVFGRIFIRIYYFFGPFFARLISKFELLRLLSFNFLIKPLHKLIKKNLLK